MRSILHAVLAGHPLEHELAPIETAIAAGSTASSVGGAFLAGYRAAVRALVPDLPADAPGCLAATEEGGAHPRAIATRLEHDGPLYRLTGSKRFVTGGTEAAWILVAASTGVDETGRNRLRMVRVDARAPGVTLTPMPPMPFTPDVSHAIARFDAVAIDAGDVLPGDGYERYLKPFRTIEDLHVHAAILAYVLGVARRTPWPETAREPLVGTLVALHALADQEPLAPETHVALAGVIALSRSALDRSRPCWELCAPSVREGWERDVPLLEIASRARAQRTASAWRALER